MDASAAPGSTHNIDPARQEFYQRLRKDNLAPLWEVMHRLVPAEPSVLTQPVLWHYDSLKHFLKEACELITAKEAERRVLILENPAFPGQAKATRTLFAGLQTILPGEIAPPHRHVAAALRFVIEGSGAYTSVDGERTIMEPGDFVITPNWTFHDHGNTSSQPMVWLDGLDMHVVNEFEAMFRENAENMEEASATDRPDGDSVARYGANMLPVDDDHTRMTSPIFNYPYTRTREALEKMKKREKWNDWHGLQMKYINPRNGDYAIPTIATFMQMFPKGFKTKPYRSTASTVFVCVEGKGKTVMGDKTFNWGPRDIFVIPSWVKHHHEASEEAVMFSYSDRGVQEKLDFFREQKFPAA